MHPATYNGKCINCGSGELDMKLRCVCGKVVGRTFDKICPEHKEEFMKIYTFRTDSVIKSLMYVVHDLVRRVGTLEDMISFLFEYVKKLGGGVA